MSKQHFDRLLQKAFEGRLSDSETTELREWLKQNPEDMDRYLEHCQMEAWLRDPELQVAPEEGKVVAIMGDPLDELKIRNRGGEGWSHGRWAITAAACVVLSLIAGWLFRGSPDGLYPVQSESVPGTVEVDKIARVIRVEGIGTINDQEGLAAGDELAAEDKIEMQKGLIEMAFRDTGVHVIATAPLSFTAKSKERLFLEDGEVKLVVPPQGIGFVVDTVERKFTDLGTSFVVTTNDVGTKVLVLDGQISVDDRNGEPERLMNEGQLARFDRNGEMKMRSMRHSGVPELPLVATEPTASALTGTIVAFPEAGGGETQLDYIGNQILPLVKSGFQDRSCLDSMIQGDPLHFRGIAGTFASFPDRVGLNTYKRNKGWLAWYHGKVRPPKAGRYRFWGYADNHLMVSIDGKPVFEGSRYDSVLHRQLDIPRENFPSFPCLNSEAGFACGQWLELDGEPIQLDVMFGEIRGNQTSAILLVECEGDEYSETYWGQPKWPLLLTEKPSPEEVSELERLEAHLTEKLMGGFSIPDQIWAVEE